MRAQMEGHARAIFLSLSTVCTAGTVQLAMIVSFWAALKGHGSVCDGQGHGSVCDGQGAACRRHAELSKQLLLDRLRILINEEHVVTVRAAPGSPR